jgi:RNA polymerase sigma factor (sigma-70 family)
MKEKTEGQHARRTNRLYEEFASYYRDHLKPWAPPNPRRVFNLAFEVVYPCYSDHVSPEQFLAEVYDVLGYCGARGRGLFETYDREKYGGALADQNHFLNLFRATLSWRLRDDIRRQAKRLRKFCPAFSPEDCGRAWSEGGHDTWMDAALLDLPDGLALLNDAEFAVIRLMYWEGRSQREAATRLGLDRATVGRRHGRALEKLRAFYGVENNFENSTFDAATGGV